jgi:GH43 family beta-xylosidase
MSSQLTFTAGATVNAPQIVEAPPALTFTNPIITSTVSSPDPWITYHEGYYYFCISWNRAIWVWKAHTISGIDRGVKVKVWSAPSTGVNSRQIWAPELHFINGRWYIYYAACDGDNATHRMFVLESSSADAQGQYLDRGIITDPEDRWAIDGTVVQTAADDNDAALYFIWSGWPGDRNGKQNIYIAAMSNPWTISSNRVLISTPTYKWEGWINEGPQVLRRDNRTFVVYSANASWKADYCLGLLTNSDGQLLNGASWSKHPEPVFQKLTEVNGVYSTGHCSFVKSPDGQEDWILYHAKDHPRKGWKGRRTMAQKFHWREDGTPHFGYPIPAGVSIVCPSGEHIPPATPDS